MTPLIVEDVKLYYVPTIYGKFDCKECALSNGEHSCVRIWNGKLYFEEREPSQGQLYCINQPNDIVFINDTPEDIARYVAARLEST